MNTLLNPVHKFPLLDDIVLLLARLGLGIILLAHGWQKFNEWTLAGTAVSFEEMGVPAPDITSTVAASAELVGGALLLVGLFTPVVAVLNAVVQVGALFLVHIQAGVFVADGGYELVLALAVGLLLVAARGAGAISIDALLPGSRRKAQADRATAEPVAAVR